MCRKQLTFFALGVWRVYGCCFCQPGSTWTFLVLTFAAAVAVTQDEWGERDHGGRCTCRDESKVPRELLKTEEMYVLLSV